jgi:hypothetical protein
LQGTLRAKCAVLPVQASPSIAATFEAKAGIPFKRRVAGETGFVTSFAAAKEGVECFLCAPQRYLLGRATGDAPFRIASQLRKLSTLSFIRDRGTGKTPSTYPVLQSGVIKVFVMAQQVGKVGRLRCRGVQLIDDLALLHDWQYPLVVMANQELEALFHCAFSLHYRLVIVTKYRRPVLTSPMLESFQ